MPLPSAVLSISYHLLETGFVIVLYLLGFWRGYPTVAHKRINSPKAVSTAISDLNLSGIRTTVDHWRLLHVRRGPYIRAVTLGITLRSALVWSSTYRHNTLRSRIYRVRLIAWDTRLS